MLIKNISSLKPCFGDHLLIMANMCFSRPQKKTLLKHNWRHYDSVKLNSKLALVDWSNKANSVQGLWDDFEFKLINVVDSLPMIETTDATVVNKPCPSIKSKLTLRNRLFKIQKKWPTLELKMRIKNLNIYRKPYLRPSFAFYAMTFFNPSTK